MKKSLIGIVILCFLAVIVLSVIITVIDIHLMWNLGSYVDEAGISPDVVLGGSAALGMEWLRLVLSPVVILISAVGIFWVLWKNL